MLKIPNNCPNCDSLLNRVKDQLFCVNTSCSAKTSKQLLHFVKTMKIMGLGEKSLDKLSLGNICDIYALTKDQLNKALGTKIGTKLFDQIASSKLTELSTFITAFGIPLIGKTAASKLSTANTPLWGITAAIAKKTGLGEKAVDSLVQWIKENKEMYSNLPITTTISKTTMETTLNVVITGKLDDFTSRTKAKEHLESCGVKLLGTLSSNANYLVCDTGIKTSSSYKKAEKLNIPVITMKELFNIIKET